MDAGAATKAGSGVVFLFTDYSLSGPYVGQLHGALHSTTGGAVRCIDLMHDVPAYQTRAGAYLLAAVLPYLPSSATVLAVVDPGVGTSRDGLVVELGGGQWLVGPDNGLLAVAASRVSDARVWVLPEPEPGVSATFHGRDWFAPAAARVAATGEPPRGCRETGEWVGRGWPEDHDGIVYEDGYGNLISGRRAGTVPSAATLLFAGQEIPWGRKFADVPPGRPLWYANSLGLVEIAVNQGAAASLLGRGVGEPLDWRIGGSSVDLGRV